MWIDIHRATRFVVEKLADSGLARRMQISALASRVDACEWYRRLGFEYEGTMRGMGHDGEDVAWYGRVIPGTKVEVL